MEILPSIVDRLSLRRHVTGIREEVVLGQLRNVLYELLFACDPRGRGLPSRLPAGRKIGSRLDGQCEGGNDAGESSCAVSTFTIMGIGALMILVVLVRPLGSPGHLDRLHQKMA